MGTRGWKSWLKPFSWFWFWLLGVGCWVLGVGRRRRKEGDEGHHIHLVWRWLLNKLNRTDKSGINWLNMFGNFIHCVHFHYVIITQVLARCSLHVLSKAGLWAHACLNESDYTQQFFLHIYFKTCIHINAAHSATENRTQDKVQQDYAFIFLTVGSFHFNSFIHFDRSVFQFQFLFWSLVSVLELWRFWITYIKAHDNYHSQYHLPCPFDDHLNLKWSLIIKVEWSVSYVPHPKSSVLYFPRPFAPEILRNFRIVYIYKYELAASDLEGLNK